MSPEVQLLLDLNLLKCLGSRRGAAAYFEFGGLGHDISLLGGMAGIRAILDLP